mmetsp:Transcript_18331/g.27768  ORF Transcript_18331/g.27768 Transcript_18331/m.27768 type:complete len:87 (+) Transcript_18331:936-1196(+)|eukprot:CAMPEP_0196136916 /NCGR_PEP_ID=MMETSP0910-20130528/5060_1 /TAXON_ID=49265 /ORGANISM="Thalassiosira rotula, Strain GSO102" /LENGTH=86 /DNA_ID=CAMNT_0041397281 /DNA_START=22 /DNA_END=282 /DNA_ORIENTATION=+
MATLFTNYLSDQRLRISALSTWLIARMTDIKATSSQHNDRQQHKEIPPNPNNLTTQGIAIRREENNVVQCCLQKCTAVVSTKNRTT